jgi:hypothetical protein
MVSVLASNLVDRGFDPQSGQTKYYTIGICCFSAKHAALRRKNTDWLDNVLDNVLNRFVYLQKIFETDNLIQTSSNWIMDLILPNC